MTEFTRVFGKHIAEELTMDQLSKLGGGAGPRSPDPTSGCFTTNVSTSSNGGPAEPDEPDWVCGMND